MGKVKIEGLDKLQEKLQKLEGKIREGVVKALDDSALAVLRSAQIKCPVDTGNLRASLTKEVNKENLYAVVGTSVYYAPYQEYGTRRTKPHPYLRPAYEENRKDINANIKQAVLEAIKKL